MNLKSEEAPQKQHQQSKSTWRPNHLLIVSQPAREINSSPLRKFNSTFAVLYSGIVSPNFVKNKHVLFILSFAYFLVSMVILIGDKWWIINKLIRTCNLERRNLLIKLLYRFKNSETKGFYLGNHKVHRVSYKRIMRTITNSSQDITFQ